MHIKAEGLVKRINGIPFINGLSLEARAGHILGLVGPEGAGKTTVLQLLLNLIPCDEGQVTIDDKPLTGKVLDRMGFLPEKGGSYPVHSLNQTLINFARLKNMPRKKASVEAVRLIDRFGMIDL
ncbi:MAG TPA: ATP-binding cassette domain-containing protein, partial [Calditrichia bacterium]|nr:ATP-binding cassette domain-containing protein [Calditrichia bacterium]